MQYVLRELFDNLEITLTELSRRSGISDVTLISIRNGKSARRSTINTLLRVFSDIYGVNLTLKNVEGIIIQGKPVGSKMPVTEQAVTPSTNTSAIADIPIATSPQKRIVEPKGETQREKRTYKPRDTGIPDGAILAKHFAENHNVSWGTFYDHLTKGLGPGLIGMSTDTIPERDRVKHEAPDNPKRKGERVRYLTNDQQKPALQFWRRHGVPFAECESTTCWCHTFF